MFGLVAAIAGLWLLGPDDSGPQIDHRGIWQESLRQLPKPADLTEPPAAPDRRPLAQPERAPSAMPPPAGSQFTMMSSQRPSEADDYRAAVEAEEGAGVPSRLQPGPKPAAPAATLPESLAPAPVPREPHDLPAWLRYAARAELVDDRPAIAIVIDDLGMNRRNTAEVSTLPGPLTLAFLPYAGDLARQTEAARTAGHELLVHIPMEPVGAQWPGPDALMSSLSEAEFALRLEKSLQSFSGFVGINNHMGSRLTADRHWMSMVMRVLHQRDLLFLDSKTSPGSVAADEADRQHVPNAVRDVFLDNETTRGAIQTQLDAVERVARHGGMAVAIGHPYDATIEALRRWLPTLADRGLALVPISTVVARRSCRDGLLAPSACGHYVQAQTPTQSVAARRLN